MLRKRAQIRMSPKLCDITIFEKAFFTDSYTSLAFLFIYRTQLRSELLRQLILTSLLNPDDCRQGPNRQSTAVYSRNVRKIMDGALRRDDVHRLPFIIL